MPGTHGFLALGARVGGAAPTYDVRRQAARPGNGPVFFRLLFGLLERRDEEPDGSRALQLGDRLDDRPALAGALTARDEGTRADLRQLVDTVPVEHGTLE